MTYFGAVYIYLCERMYSITIKEKNILLLSDTHAKHRLLDISPRMDIVIHCGDICNGGDMEEITDFFDWYSNLDIPYKIFVNGNHDLPFELNPQTAHELVPKGVIWLNDRSIVIDSIKITGLSPFFFYSDIDTGTSADIIVSHYPPSGILDGGKGIPELLDYITTYKPKYHVYGHHHPGCGQLKTEDTLFINASNYNELNEKG